jgi:transposase-like protein
MGRPGYPAEFRRKVLDLLADGRSVASVAHDLDVTDQPIYNWRHRDLLRQAHPHSKTCLIEVRNVRISGPHPPDHCPRDLRGVA